MIIIAEKTFKKSFKRLIKKSPHLQAKILAVLELLAEDPFYPSLKSHKLTGQLHGLWSCSVTYSYRIIFTFRQDTELEEDVIVLIDIGDHDEVY
jgi:addiction module RelE/StbE family toxin